MVRIETILAPVLDEVVVVHAIASTASATASSSLAGSKMMFGPTAMARIMTGGLSRAEDLDVDLGYSGEAASQSSSKSGSSSFSDLREGRCVVRRARCVVMERRPRGYESGGERRRI